MSASPLHHLGVLGGGQLGWMIALEAQRLGVHTSVMDASVHCAAARAADVFHRGDVGDAEAVRAMARDVDVLTVETEHVHHRVLAGAESVTRVRPAASVLKTVQDRLAEREFLARHQFPQTRFWPVADAGQCRDAARELSGAGIIKGRFGGYDGKGQARADNPAGLEAAWAEIGNQPAVLEAVVPFEREISVIVARGTNDDIRLFPLAENLHRDHILNLTIAPARVSGPVADAAREIGVGVARTLDHVGVIAVELFVLPDGSILVNEIAPRVHNSGHYTLGACLTSQFEQHVRAVCGLPLGETRQLAPAVMLNLLGDLWADGEPDWPKVLATPGASLYLYGKSPARPGRKMGHLLFLDDDPQVALQAAQCTERQLREAVGSDNH